MHVLVLIDARLCGLAVPDYHFRPHRYYWILIIIARKAGIAFTALMFNKNAAFQLSMALLVMFVAYALQVRFQPFMSMSERAEVLREHERLALIKGSVDQRLAASLLEVKKKAKRAVTRRLVWDKKGINAAVLRQAVANYFWSYNTVGHRSSQHYMQHARMLTTLSVHRLKPPCCFAP